MQSFIARFLELLRVLLYGWVAGVLALWRALFGPHPDRHLRERDRRAAKSPCVPIDDPAFIRPDPLIYSQEKLMSLGLSVTWDNPDVQLYEAGVPVGSYDLKPATAYEARIRVWNNSVDCPVVNMPVHLSYALAGVGLAGQPIGSATVDVGVKGSATQPGFCSIGWTTPPTAGHYCLKVLLDPVVDTDLTNNMGQENTQVGAAHSPAQFHFELRNDDRVRHAYRFDADAYALRARPPCGEDPGHGDDERGAERARRRREQHHLLGEHPVPAGWTVDCAPPDPVLAPGDQVTIAVAIEPPDGWAGSQTVNVNAFHEDGLAGGMTFTVTR